MALIADLKQDSRYGQLTWDDRTKLADELIASALSSPEAERLSELQKNVVIDEAQGRFSISPSHKLFDLSSVANPKVERDIVTAYGHEIPMPKVPFDIPGSKELGLDRSLLEDMYLAGVRRDENKLANIHMARAFSMGKLDEVYANYEIQRRLAEEESRDPVSRDGLLRSGLMGLSEILADQVVTFSENPKKIAGMTAAGFAVGGPAGAVGALKYAYGASAFLSGREEFLGMMLEEAIDKGYDLNLMYSAAQIPAVVYAGIDVIELMTFKKGFSGFAKDGMTRLLKSKTLDFAYKLAKNHGTTVAKEVLQEAAQRGVEETTKDIVKYITYEGWPEGESWGERLQSLAGSMGEEIVGATQAFWLAPLPGAIYSGTINELNLRSLEKKLKPEEIKALSDPAGDQLEKLRALAKLSQEEVDPGETLGLLDSKWDKRRELQESLNQKQNVVSELEDEHDMQLPNLRNSVDFQMRREEELTNLPIKRESLDLPLRLLSLPMSSYLTNSTGVHELDATIRNPILARQKYGLVAQALVDDTGFLYTAMITNERKVLAKSLNVSSEQVSWESAKISLDTKILEERRKINLNESISMPLPFIHLIRKGSDITISHAPLRTLAVAQILGMKDKIPLVVFHEGYGTLEDATFDQFLPDSTLLGSNPGSYRSYKSRSFLAVDDLLLTEGSTVIPMSSLHENRDSFISLLKGMRGLAERLKAQIKQLRGRTFESDIHKEGNAIFDEADFFGFDFSANNLGLFFDSKNAIDAEMGTSPGYLVNLMGSLVRTYTTFAPKTLDDVAILMAEQMVDTATHELAHSYATHLEKRKFNAVHKAFRDAVKPSRDLLISQLKDLLKENDYAVIRKLKELYKKHEAVYVRGEALSYFSNLSSAGWKARAYPGTSGGGKGKRTRSKKAASDYKPKARLEGRVRYRYRTNERGEHVIHQVAVRDKTDFFEKSFRGSKVDGATVLYGQLKEGGRSVYRVEFPEKWSKELIEAWLLKHPVERKLKEFKDVSETATLRKAKSPQVVAQTKKTSKLLRALRPSHLLASFARSLGIEVTKVAEQKFGKDVPARILRAIFTPEAEVWSSFALQRTSRGDSLEELEREISKLPIDVREAIMDARGEARTEGGQERQRRARARLTPYQLELASLVQEAADFNLAVMKDLGFDVKKFDAYFYGVYKDPQRVADVLQKNRVTTQKFLEQKIIPTVADARAMGLELVDSNPISNLRREFTAIWHLKAMEELSVDMMKYGKGIYIDQAKRAPIDWVTIGSGRYTEPAFKKLRVHPDVAKVLNNLISTNFFGQNKALRGFRAVNRTLQSVKFFFPFFHFRTIFTAALTDVNMMSIFNPLKWPHNLKTAALAKITERDKREVLTVNGETHLLFKDYLKVGGGEKYSLEVDAFRAFEDLLAGNSFGRFFNRVTAMPRWGARLTTLPWRKITSWLFETYIPAVKFQKYKDAVRTYVLKTGEYPSDSQRVEFLKEIQNIYGEMNERLFGRSGTMTSFLRILFLAPGFAEGNFRTNAKALFQWKSGRISRANIVQSFIILGILTAIARRILEGAWPEPPESLDEFRDFFKLRTGKKDTKGQEIYLDLMTFEKDYWEGLIRPVLLSTASFNEKGPLKAGETFATEITNELFKRLKGMTAPSRRLIGDLMEVWDKGYLYDWRGEKVVQTTDTKLQALNKILQYELQNFEPIGFGVYRTLRRETSLSATSSLVASLFGLRVGKSEEVLQQNRLRRDLWSLKDQRTELGYELAYVDAPRSVIEDYNDTIRRVFSDPYMSKGLQKELDLTEDKLSLNADQLLASKVYRLTNPNLTDQEALRILRYLKNFEVTNPAEYRKHLRRYFKSADTGLDTQAERLRRLSSRLLKLKSKVTK